MISPAFESHIRDTVRLWLGLRPDQVELVPIMPAGLCDLLFRREEWDQGPRDQWGNWEHGLADNYQRGRLWWPEVDDWLEGVRAGLPAAARPLPLWPEAKRFAVLLTHDVDLVSEEVTVGQLLRRCRIPNRSAPLRTLYSLASRRIRYRAWPDLDPMLGTASEIERQLGVKASYFFTYHTVFDRQEFDCCYLPGDPCRFRGERQRIRDAMRLLYQDGHDIGLHGSYRSALDGVLLRREREQMAAETGLPISTTRQHWLHWGPLTPRHQEAAGLIADTTLGYNRNIGFRCGTSLPFESFDRELDRPIRVLQVPLHIQDGALFNSSGLELDEATAQRVCETIMDRVAAVGGVLSLLFHPDALVRPPVRRLFEHLIRAGLEGGAWFATLREVHDWWRRRAAVLAAPTGASPMLVGAGE